MHRSCQRITSVFPGGIEAQIRIGQVRPGPPPQRTGTVAVFAASVLITPDPEKRVAALLRRIRVEPGVPFLRDQERIAQIGNRFGRFRLPLFDRRRSEAAFQRGFRLGGNALEIPVPWTSTGRVQINQSEPCVPGRSSVISA